MCAMIEKFRMREVEKPEGPTPASWLEGEILSVVEWRANWDDFVESRP